jgi:hypothetical protein
VSRGRVGRVGQAALTVALAGLFALVGLGIVMAIAGFGPSLGLCIPGARSLNGFTPMVGGGEMATHLCASQAAAASIWPWPIVGVTAGAIFGAIFAIVVLTVLRVGIRGLRRPPRAASLAQPS